MRGTKNEDVTMSALASNEWPQSLNNFLRLCSHSLDAIKSREQTKNCGVLAVVNHQWCVSSPDCIATINYELLPHTEE